MNESSTWAPPSRRLQRVAGWIVGAAIFLGVQPREVISAGDTGPRPEGWVVTQRPAPLKRQQNPHTDPSAPRGGEKATWNPRDVHIGRSWSACARAQPSHCSEGGKQWWACAWCPGWCWHPSTQQRWTGRPQSGSELGTSVHRNCGWHAKRCHPVGDEGIRARAGLFVASWACLL